MEKSDIIKQLVNSLDFIYLNPYVINKHHIQAIFLGNYSATFFMNGFRIVCDYGNNECDVIMNDKK